jgi:hypothetical protein
MRSHLLRALQKKSPGAMYDPDAAAYFALVETADSEALEPELKQGISDWVVAEKAAGRWDKYFCIGMMCAARTQAGFMYNLKGPHKRSLANFSLSNYDRKNGWSGAATTNNPFKRLVNTGVYEGDMIDNDVHASVNVTKILGPEGGMLSSHVSENRTEITRAFSSSSRCAFSCQTFIPTSVHNSTRDIAGPWITARNGSAAANSFGFSGNTSGLINRVYAAPVETNEFKVLGDDRGGTSSSCTINLYTMGEFIVLVDLNQALKDLSLAVVNNIP